MTDPKQENAPANIENVLFTDIFRRADKNDDGKISLEEFFTYFGDNILSDSEILALFESIDSNKNHNIEVEELIEYFQKGFGPYSPLFIMLEGGHKAVKDVLTTLSQSYISLSCTDQHKVRFYLQEFLHQIEMLHKAIHRALKTIKKTTPTHRPHFEDTIPSRNKQTKNKLGNLLTEPEKSGSERTVEVMEKLENAKIALNLAEQTEPDDSGLEGCTVVSREHHVDVEQTEDYVEATREYLRATRLEEGCFYVYVKKNTEKQTYQLYEIWISADALMAHYQKPHYKTHAKAIIDFLVVPEKQGQMVIPVKWLQGKDE